MPTPPCHLIAALVSRTDSGIDQLVASFARSLIARGRRVRGLVQEMHPDEQGCTFSLCDLEAGKRYAISQDLGTCALACRVDTAGIAEASEVYRRLDDNSAELVIFNRFGGLEAQSEGFSAEMADIMSRGIPSLTIVSEKHRDAWLRFTGDLAIELDGQPQALEDWFSGALQDARPAHES